MKPSIQPTSEWTLNLAEASATHVSGLTVVALPGRGRSRYRAVPLQGTLPVPGLGLSEDDCDFVAQVVSDRVREGCDLLLQQLRHRPAYAVH